MKTRAVTEQIWKILIYNRNGWNGRAGRDSGHPINPLAINSRDMKGNEIKLFIRFARHDRAGKLVRNELQQGGIQAGRCGGGWKMRRELARVTACCCQFAMRGK